MRKGAGHKVGYFLNTIYQTFDLFFVIFYLGYSRLQLYAENTTNWKNDSWKRGQDVILKYTLDGDIQRTVEFVNKRLCGHYPKVLLINPDMIRTLP